MAKAEFTEMQYVLGFVSEFTKYIRQATGQTPYFTLPSPHVESTLGIDIMIKYFDHFEFHQYKRSDFLNTHNAVEYTKGLPRSYKPYYRFTLYDDKPSLQFTRLRYLADMDLSNKVYYVAPKFHTSDDFQAYFWNEEIMDNSIFVNCLGFNSARIRKYLNKTQGKHRLVFSDSNNSRYLFSDGIELNDNEDLFGYKSIRLKGENNLFTKIVSELYYTLSEDKPSLFLSSNEKDDLSIRQQFKWVHNKLLLKYNINMIPISNI